MSFLQPLFLIGLPLVALPVIIHLINQRRYQTVRWAAMMFLLAANRMSRGYARLRQFLILLFRTLLILGLIFALSRPLASGSLGAIAGGRADTTIVLLDRSPSMQQRGRATSSSKLSAGRQKLAATLNKLGSIRWVLIDSANNVATEIESPDSLLDLPSTSSSDTSADLPAMLEKARDYVRENKTGRTEIWICSDVQRNDWRADSGRWQAIRDSFLELPQGIRFHLLAYSTVDDENLSIRVSNVRRQKTSDGAELLVSLRIERVNSEGTRRFPVEFEIQGARSQLDVEMVSSVFELKDHRIPIERSLERGWGKVSIPADTNPADNDFYFVFDKPPPRQTLIVSEDLETSWPLHLAATIAPDPAVTSSAETISPLQWATADWQSLSLVVWHAPLPDEDTAADLARFVDRGGQLVFMPPTVPGNRTFMGMRWQEWVEDAEGIPVETWRGDQDLLAHVNSGMALPVGQLRIHRFCRVEGEATGLAELKGGHALLARVPTNRGGVYFCGTTSRTSDSSLASNGVVLYVMLQRAILTGAAELGTTRSLPAGAAESEEALAWQPLASSAEALSTEYVHHRGIYADDARLLAVNRAPGEDQPAILSDDRVAALFNGLEYSRVDDRVGSLAGLVQEIWRLFLIAGLIAVLAEAFLCMPRRRLAVGEGSRPSFNTRNQATRAGGVPEMQTTT